MTLRPRPREIVDLVRRLGSRRAREVESARARLAIHGARAVDALVEVLDGDDPRTRGHAMVLLGLIQEPRGREALVAMLHDRDPAARETAALTLARFTCPQSIPPLERLFRKDRDPDVRLAALRGLVELCAAGQESALATVLATLVDRDAPSRLREAALGVLPILRPAVRRGILRRLREDPSPAIVRLATEFEEREEPGSRPRPAPIAAAVEALASDDWAVWNDAVRRLAACGAAAVVPIVEAMRRRAHDPEYCARAGMALKALGPRRAGSLGEALQHVDEPLPLQVLVEVVAAVGEKPLVYRLKDLIDRLRTLRPQAAVNGFDPLRRVRAKAHLELARIGSRVAVDDLRDMLDSPDERIEVEALAAVERVGKREEIPPLLSAWNREDRQTRAKVSAAVRTILRRERIRRNSRFLSGLDPARRRALQAILPPPAARRSRHGRARAKKR